MFRIPSIAVILCGFTAIPVALRAQDPCEGSGIGAAYVSTTPAILGSSIELDMGSPLAPNSVALLLFGNDGAPSFPFCLDTSQLFVSLLAVLDATGNAHFDLGVGPAAFDAKLFAKPLVWEGTNWSLGKTVRIQTEYANSYREIAPMINPRSLHTCTSLSDGPTDNATGAFVAGGATGNLIAPTAIDTTEVFSTITREWTAGPMLGEARSRHAVVKFDDGTMLISGGMTNAVLGTGGPATSSCDHYIPDANVIVPFAPMLNARMGHCMTKLNDGRILVTGGFGDWTDAGPNFAARLNTAQDSTEIYDPTNNTWSAGPTMASKRGGHTQTLLADGRVLICAGTNGGTQIPVWIGTFIDVPTFTDQCEIFDPVTNTLAATATITLARGFHAASTLPSGEVLVTGGAASLGTNGDATAANSCAIWNPTTGAWSIAPPLPTGVAFHSQIQDQDSGDAIIMGGFVGGFVNLQGSNQTVRHDGTTATVLSVIGTNPGLTQPDFATGTQAGAQMHDGTILLTGGFEWVGLTGIESARAMLYVK